ncbi:organic hydroperoxide resistance protein [Pseudoroseomonas rhizosphaerae]|uniref:Organic hydroperoxide resistance protein n=1 Tax=Teichococcus rhizosphaerae TaxID=1335062 RepID=A0A2C6Z569_9PROT|nr:organic hydroperoxide resistance protein [Pseudoroseomonas rhizosphaerae]PHK93641.1 organic hydroperoxide resistance protein [Pseudoroseomonas rhizosphaerae]
MALYTGSATAQGGRNGHVASSDGLISQDLSIPKEMGGPGKAGATNPEQLFAAGYAACFSGAVDAVGRQKKLDTTGSTVTCDVGIDKVEGGFQLSAKLKVKLPALDKAQAQELVEAAHQMCPYSKATRGNIDVSVEAV